MNLLIIGSGGREHALAWAASRSARVQKIYTAPGNAGTALLGANLPIGPTEAEKLVQAATERAVSLVIIGPESALVAGVADRLRAAGIAVVGPDRAAAQIEGSKIFAKQFMDRHGIPTARWQQFQDPRSALQALEDWREPPVIKADGLAAGKGVFIPSSREEATRAIGALMVDNRFGDAGREIIFEENLHGEEVSFLAVTDGKDYVAFPPAQDHKRIWDQDRGPNTGGMGAYAPTTLVDEILQKRIEHEVMLPFLAGMRSDGHDYRGIIYAGLMIVNGQPLVLEFNARFGDPECQPLLLGLESDFVELMERAATGHLSGYVPQWYAGSTCAVVMAAEGYPDDPRLGDTITVPQTISSDCALFFAGARVAEQHDGAPLITAGGRVLTVTARGATLRVALDNAYHLVEQIHFRGAHFRRDIGHRELVRT